MEIRDYNGSGDWSKESILARYREYCAKFSVVPLEIISRERVGDSVTWIYPVMDPIIEAAKKGDIACLQICIDFVQQDQKFPFGRTLKSQAAKALRRQAKLLTDGQKDSLRTRVLEMLLRRFTPQEFGDYVRLVKRIGVGDSLRRLSVQELSQEDVRRFCTTLGIETKPA